MANYFSNRNDNLSKKAALRAELRNIRKQEEAEYADYIMRVQNLIKSRPGLTASQYAMLMSNDACERNSIQMSISNMGYMAEAHEKGWVKRAYGGYDAHAVCANPSMPSLKRKQTMVKRRFIEVDENNQPIGTHETTEYCTIYNIKEG